MDDTRVFGDYAWYMLYRIMSFFPQSAPVEPNEDVKALITESKLTQTDIVKMYKVYQTLYRQEVLVNYHRFRTSSISVGSIINVVPDHREFVVTLLRNILQLGGCYEYIDWNHFLYILIKFCSLTKVELCQLLFLIIVRESRGLDVHYLTSTQLDRFYLTYRSDNTEGVESVPVSMDCSKIHFSNFPLSRYYMTDFVEVCFLYSQLINPLLYLQRQFQRVLPSLRFWDRYENTDLIGNRKITIDFFLIKKTNINLLTDDIGFQEASDLLLLSSELIHTRISDKRGQLGSAGWSNLFSGINTKDHQKDNYERNLELEFLSKSRQHQNNANNQASSMATIYSKVQKTSLIKN